MSRYSRRKRQRAGGLQRQLVGHLAVVLAGEFEAGDLERALDRAEVRDDDLVVLHGAVEERLAHQRVGGGILEQAAAGDAGALDAGAVQQFAPAAGGFRMRDVDGLGVEGEPARAQARDGDEARPVGDLDEQVLAFLGSHVGVLSSCADARDVHIGSVTARKRTSA